MQVHYFLVNGLSQNELSDITEIHFTTYFARFRRRTSHIPSSIGIKLRLPLSNLIEIQNNGYFVDRNHFNNVLTNLQSSSGMTLPIYDRQCECQPKIVNSLETLHPWFNLGFWR